MQRILLFSMSLMLILASCKKTIVNPTTIVYNDTTGLEGDRQIRFSLPDASMQGTKYWLSDQQVNIQKFNIDYYAGVDSVFYSFYSSSQDGSNGTVELYNFTDSVSIAGSLINVLTNGGDIVYFQSGNLKAAFPHKEITVGLRLKGSVEGGFFNATYGNLYLYRQ